MRRELRVLPTDPLCPWQLAGHLEFFIVRLSEFARRAPREVTYLQSGAGQKEFSAVTLDIDGQSWIIHNDTHDPKRQAANIAHELAHGLLVHKPNPLLTAMGTRYFDRTQEDEANWLGPALLISEEAALLIAREGMSIASASNHYGASEEVVRMRMNVCAAWRRLRLAAQPEALRTPQGQES
ncbi:ImmA/IrrE family metallo-endopeptidase [Rhodoplanes elegans]|nr:ImmA/IrrE family metallo-endopeptidase [Rhodoplanes elegans]